MIIPVFDGHNDTLLNLYEPGRGKGRSFFEASNIGHIDLPRAKIGGFAGGFFAVFIPTPASGLPADASEKEMVSQFLDAPPLTVDPSYALEKTLGMARLMFDLERAAPDEVKVVRSVDELEQCLADRTVAMIFHIEGAEAIDPNLDALHVLHAAGLRSIGIVWSRPNAFGHGVPFAFPSSPDTGPGLTDAGHNLVKTCNELGILVDLSHLNEKGFWDVADLSNRPLVATHSGVHELCNSSRNLTDEQMRAILDTNGVMGINFHVGFLREDGARDANTPINEIVRHIDYAVNLMGVDHVALGSDFDGATMPDELGDVTGLPRLIEALIQQGYTEAEVRKIAAENWVRVLKETWIG